MQKNHSKWLATLALGVLGAAGATAAQAQITVSPYLNISVGSPLTEGVYGRIQFGPGVAVPPLYAATPVLVRRPVVRSQPVYMYVPNEHRLNWSNYCGRYGACGQSVYFVNTGAMRQPAIHRERAYRPTVATQRHYSQAPRRVVVQQRHDNGRHNGWYKDDRRPGNARSNSWNNRNMDHRR